MLKGLGANIWHKLSNIKDEKKIGVGYREGDYSPSKRCCSDVETTYRYRTGARMTEIFCIDGRIADLGQSRALETGYIGFRNRDGEPLVVLALSAALAANGMSAFERYLDRTARITVEVLDDGVD